MLADLASRQFSSHRWLKYLESSSLPSLSALVSFYRNSVCNQWRYEHYSTLQLEAAELEAAAHSIVHKVNSIKSLALLDCTSFGANELQRLSQSSAAAADSVMGLVGGELNQVASWCFPRGVGWSCSLLSTKAQRRADPSNFGYIFRADGQVLLKFNV